MDELRLAVRRLRKRPAATLASIVTLAGAVGAAVAMWTILNALLLKPLPVRDPATLMTVVADYGGRESGGFLYNHYRDLTGRGIFSDTAGWGTMGGFRLKDPSGERPAVIQFISHNYVSTLGITPPLGRAFAAGEDQDGAPLVAMLSHKYWERTFAKDPAVIGAAVHVMDRPVTIVGVAPRGFRGVDLASGPELFMPLHAIEAVERFGNYLQSAREQGNSPTSWISIVGRLESGASEAGVTAQLNVLPWLEARRGPRASLRMVPLDVAALPMRDRAGVVRFTRLLTITVGLLLLVGCATVALLLLVRTEDRRLEFATCLALGASKARLVRGVALEGALMAAGGALLAIPIARWIFSLLETFSLPGNVALGDLALQINLTAIAVAAAGCLLVLVFVALVMALSNMTSDAVTELRAQTATTRPSRRPARAALITAQIAAAVVLIAGTTLFVRSLVAAVTVNPGRDAGRMITASFPLRQHGYEPARTVEFYRELAARLAGNPAIARMSLVTSMGGTSGGARREIDGVPKALPGYVANIGVHDQYFDTMGLPVLSGRGFGPEDHAASPKVAVVSESFGRFLGDGGSPLGHRYRLDFAARGEAMPDVTVVGVVPDLITNVRQLQPLTVYLHAPQYSGSSGIPNQITVLAAGDPEAARREIMSVGRALDPAVAPVITTLSERLLAQMRPQQLGATVLGALGLIAGLLTMLGLYVIAESTAAQRTRELGIRAALGATRRELRALLLRDNLRLAAIGAALGLAIVYAGAGTIRAFLFGVEAFDPVTLTAVPSAIVILAVLVGLGPAARASRADVAQVLRRE